MGAGRGKGIFSHWQHAQFIGNRFQLVAYFKYDIFPLDDKDARISNDPNDGARRRRRFKCRKLKIYSKEIFARNPKSLLCSFVVGHVGFFSGPDSVERDWLDDE